MTSLFNDWIQLFDENNFKNLKYEPEQLKNINMLFITIQNEFKKLETSISDKILTLKNECSKENLPKKNVPGNTTKIQSPILERHKSRSKKFKKNLDFELKNRDLFTNSKNIQSKVQCELRTSIGSMDDEDIFESSIIPETPDLKRTKKIKRKTSPKKKYNSFKNSTLTQMYPEMSIRKTETTDPSMMEIDEILGKVDNASSVLKEKTISKKPRMFSSFIDYDEIPERSKSPKKTFVFKETVRGNARKKLPGWSCKDCENFYKGMGLTDEELEKKMNECSKHRSRFKPDEETMAGYWDLSIPPTPDCHKTQKPSPSDLSQFSQESVGHNSTIFL